MPNGEEQPRAYESRVKLKRRNRARKSISTHDGNYGPDSDSEVTKDSGYNSLSDGEFDSESDADIEPMDVEQKMREYREKGATLSNPGDETRIMMEMELEKWER